MVGRNCAVQDETTTEPGGYMLARRMLVPALVLAISVPAAARGAQVTDSSAHGQAGADKQTAKQLEELRGEVARLQAALEQQRGAAPQPSGAQQPGAGMRGMEPGMPMEGMDKMEMGGMDKMEMGGRSGGMGMMDMHEGEMGMPPEGMEMPDGMMMEDDKGRMGGMSPGPGMAPGGMPAAPTTGPVLPSGSNAPRSMSSLPGVPGGSHLYHVGSTGFFLDQPRITLTSEQRSALNKIKERALLERGNAERRVEQAEQELWVLTGADRPEAGKVEAKAREIERLRTNQRLAFIQAVGEATKLLTPEQRGRLLGTGTTPAK